MWLTYELTLNTSTLIMRLVCLEIIFFWGHWGEAHWPWPRGGPHHPPADHLWQPEGVCQDPAKRGDTAQHERAAERHPVIKREKWNKYTIQKCLFLLVCLNLKIYRRTTIVWGGMTKFFSKGFFFILRSQIHLMCLALFNEWLDRCWPRAHCNKCK